ncbi:ABC transporter permease [Kribbella solani]|uniref:ABC-2 type transport system permease protein n=1 Tax=Kribbella solani TaxID=236067 RepID=A0A841DGI3_9ACTN|nr:ABC transporter permease [Kribbella solani]MBB5977622.1 ABC-2 type transport system permease protein [Kribbella solani]
MKRAAHAEWTKLRTTSGTAWLLVVTAIVTAALGAAVSAASQCAEAGCGIDASRLLLSGVYLGQAPVAVLAVLAVSGEYSTSLIRTTLTAVPARTTVLVAKAGVVGAVVLVAGALILLIALQVTGFVLGRHGFTAAHGYPHLSLADPAIRRATAAALANLVLLAVLSTGIAAVVRDSAAAIGAVLGLLYLPPILTPLIAAPAVRHAVERLAPLTATPLVLSGWAAVGLLAGAMLLRRRDT